MPQSQIDLPALAKSIADAYDASINLNLDQPTRLKFQVSADALSAKFDELSGRWFSDTAAEFTDATKALEDCLDAMEKPLQDAAEAIAALGFLKSLTGALDALLGLL